MESARPRNAETSALEPRLNFTVRDLFPELLPPVLPACWPSKGTRAEIALTALLSGPVDQAHYRDTWRLAACVKTLQYLGWGFRKRSILLPGCRTAIAEYTLDVEHPGTAAALLLRKQGCETGEPA
jgi:hypothetical protein